MDYSPYYHLRDELVAALLRDLHGPGSEHEVIEDDPINQYIIGVLYPQSGALDESLDNESPNENGDQENLPDPPVSLANVKYPSSLGLTFAVDLHATQTIAINGTVASYKLVFDGVGADSDDAAPKKSGRRRGSAIRRTWQRVPICLQPLELDLSNPQSGRYEETGIDGLRYFYRIRPVDGRGHVAVTVVLLNVKKFDFADSELGIRDADSFFQPELRVSAPDASHSAFVERPMIAELGDDEDVRAYQLLYRHAKEFAAGHGCSVDWTVSDSEPDRAVSVHTTFVPRYPLRLAVSNPNIQGKALSMRFLAEAPRDTVLEALTQFCDGYRDWIHGVQTEAKTLEVETKATAASHIEAGHIAERRMRAGIKLLEEDDTTWRAFALMNAAMSMQLARSVWLKQDKPTDEPLVDDSLKWFPFQLAFILLCLKGTADAESPDRRLADLLWFPTGGGKTEAYLGLIAFTIMLRRLRGSDGGGVTVLMRYTLRLLTLQQFQRATLLICTLEDLRRKSNDLGPEPISIGMWVGRSATPNTRDEAAESLKKLRSVMSLEEKNPVQLQTCPWCGHGLDHRNYWMAVDRPRLVISCRTADCAFSDGLPVYLVDEDIYDYRPTLIISTVDKFAGLPWLEQARNIFNRRTHGRKEQLPPELIIQDELHLISGPLGTLTGLYETAVDLLCTQNGSPPKIIASTATIRRASHQALGLFNREIRQFPPPGIDARDSYFAVEASPEEKGTRQYVGIMAPGTSHTYLMVRSYAALLQGIMAADGNDQIADPYWTLVGYFNSLRVLGGARMQVHDDVEEWIRRVSQLSGIPSRSIEMVIELTSREQSGRISEYLKQLTLSRPHPASPDVVLATNMISVGVDIDRLGLMVVMGQPQSTSEYIQATSRVGRKYPGLVVVLFNAAKSRDRSHYESFVAFHSAIYRQVESTTVTPFSARARDRGLHAVLVAMVRLLIPELQTNKGAGAVLKNEGSLKAVAELIVNRVRQVAPEEADATAKQLDEIIGRWCEMARNERDGLQYRDRDTSKALLVDAGVGAGDAQNAFPTLWSLRDVDRESNMYLVRLDD